MSNFTPVAFIDVFDLGASLLRKPKGDEMTLLDRVRVLEHLSRRWAALADVMDRIKDLAAPHSWEAARVCLDVLDPGERVGWSDALSYQTILHVPIRTNPQAAMIAGTEICCPGVGFATIVNQQVPNCAINMGETPRIHLVVEMRKVTLAITNEFQPAE
jgi:hypothetical protein